MRCDSVLGSIPPSALCNSAQARMDRRNEVAFTETQPDPSDQENQEQDPNLRLLREKAKRADDLDATNKSLARELAMVRSGIDVDHPLGDFFVKSYDGDPADIETLKAKAAELGVPFKGSPVIEETPPEPVVAEEPTGTAERRTLSDGAPADTGEDEDPRKIAKDTYDRMMAAGAPQDEAAGEHFATLARAAMAGDKRVIVE